MLKKVENRVPLSFKITFFFLQRVSESKIYESEFYSTISDLELY